MHKLLFILFLFAIAVNAQVVGIDIEVSSPKIKVETGKDVIDFMYQEHKQAPCKAYSFSQKNTHYRNDSVIGNSEWHEYIEFPDKFRIDFGETEDGNFIIFKNDSSYRYKNKLLKKVNENSNILLLLLGGMYYREVSDIINRLEKEHYNTKIVSEQKWNKQHLYVIGAVKGDSISNQIWVEKKNWRVVRIIEKMDSESMMDMTFDTFQKNCNGYIETKVTFKRNGKIEQVEEYYNIKPLDKMPIEVFNPK
jgi:outer membrane lipoprotein-sorting protein